jgi:enterochelin esterase-like enzyme
VPSRKLLLQAQRLCAEKDEPVKCNAWLWAALAVLLTVFPAAASGLRTRTELNRVNRHLHGQVVDHTNNHGADRRIWSAALCQKRDLYIYLPPCFDPQQQYPFMLWLHGYAQDEQSFLDYVVEPLDRAMSSGMLPPMIVAAPDGSLTGIARYLDAGSFFLNTKVGRFEDFVMQDVWNFVLESYPVRPEREAHVIAGVSMGGGAAYNLSFKYRDRVKHVIGVFPPVNLRWLDCHCKYMRPFDPCCWGWRTDFSHGCEVVGRFYVVIGIHLRRIFDDLYDIGPGTAAQVGWENPIEMIDRLGVQEGELNMYIAYGGRDQFNINAQVESFLYRAKERGLTVTVDYDPKGKHDVKTALRMFPAIVDWLAPLLAPYSPGVR